jgi:hypothetical protein
MFFNSLPHAKNIISSTASVFQSGSFDTSGEEKRENTNCIRGKKKRAIIVR